MSSNWIDSFAQKIVQAGLATEETLVGCSEAEIHELARTFKLRLPKIYVDYLRRMGKQAGDFLGECIRTYPGLLQYARQKAETLLEARTSYRLPDTAFVFVERYGCQFFYFDTASGDDNPPVYRYFEGDKEPAKIADGLTEAFEMALQDDLSDLDPASNTPYQFAI